jgi:hypothetical protein
VLAVEFSREMASPCRDVRMWKAVLVFHLCIAHAGEISRRTMKAAGVRRSAGHLPKVRNHCSLRHSSRNLRGTIRCSRLHRTARGDEMQSYLILKGPLVQRRRCKLRPVVDDDPLRQPSLQLQPSSNRTTCSEGREVPTSTASILRVYASSIDRARSLRPLASAFV